MTAESITSPITHRLKSDNWDLHQIAERGGTPESMIKGTISKSQFADTLAQSIHIHRALDEALTRATKAMLALAGLVDEGHHFEQYLATDLEYFGIGPSESLLPGVQRFIDHIHQHADNALHIFGLHYVRLGACNGNRFVARKLRQVFEIDSQTDGTRFLDPFGDTQREHWNTFKAGLDALDLTESERDELFDGTRMAYVLTINLDLEEYMSADELLKKHGKTLDREVFEQGHSVHVPSES